MNKIIKWISWALMLIGVALTAFVFIDGGTDTSVNLLIYWTYAMLVFAIVAIIYAIARESVVNPKTLVKIGIVLGVAVVLVGIAFLLAPGTPAIGYTGAPVSDGALKLTDTILNLTYFSVGVAVLTIIASAIMDSAKK